MKNRAVFLFDDELAVTPSAAVRLVGVRADLDSKEALLGELKSGLSLPSYFGDNWDALEECLRDLHWLEEKSIYIVHAGLPRLDSQSLTTYLQILRGAVLDWRADGVRELVVAFPNDAEDEVSVHLDGGLTAI